MKIDWGTAFVLTLWGLATALFIFCLAYCVNPYREYGGEIREIGPLGELELEREYAALVHEGAKGS